MDLKILFSVDIKVALVDIKLIYFFVFVLCESSLNIDGLIARGGS